MGRKKSLNGEASSGNVFVDVGLAEEYLAKAQIVTEIGDLITLRNLTQVEAAGLLGIDQPRVSALLRGRLDLFSLERLMQFLGKLGNSVEINVRSSKTPTFTVRIERNARMADVSRTVRTPKQ